MHIPSKHIYIFALSVVLLVSISRPAETYSRKDALRKRASVRARIVRVNSLMRSHPQEAIDELNRLLRKYPQEEDLILDKLGRAYMLAGKADSAIVVFKRCLKLSPSNLGVAVELAQIYANNGEKSKAEEIFVDIIRRFPNKSRGYRVVAEAQSRLGWHEQALATYKEARATLNDNLAFAFEVGDLEKMLGKDEEALEEYLAGAARNKAAMRTAKEKVIELIKGDKVKERKITALLEEKALVEDPLLKEPVLDVLSEVYLRQGLLEKALEVSLESDRLGGAKRKSLYFLIQNVFAEARKNAGFEKERRLRICLRAVEAYLARHPRALEAPDVYLFQAGILVDLSAFADTSKPGSEGDMLARSLESYDTVIKRYPGTRFALRAMLEKGDLLAKRLGKFEDALAVYRRGMEKGSDLRNAFAERIAVTLIAMHKNSEAETYCKRLMSSPYSSLQEMGKYYLGMLLAFNGQYEAARDSLTSLAEHKPASKFTNDAIDLAWVIELGLKTDSEILGKYLEALQAEAGGNRRRALRALEELSGKPQETPLRDRAVYRLGLLYRDAGDYAKALDAFNELLKDYPESQLAPSAERKIGEVYELGLGQKSKALKTYEHVLMSYPEYVFLDEVRKEILRLREERESK